jgi:transcriptional regulator with XRE-family HTH domain
MKRKSKKVGSQKRRDKDENPIVEAFAVTFKEWRASSGKRLREVAADLDLSISIVSEWENGNRFPNADHFHAIAQHTGIPAWKFLRR